MNGKNSVHKDDSEKQWELPGKNICSRAGAKQLPKVSLVFPFPSLPSYDSSPDSRLNQMNLCLYKWPRSSCSHELRWILLKQFAAELKGLVD